jgi:hypothetical protein
MECPSCRYKLTHEHHLRRQTVHVQADRTTMSADGGLNLTTLRGLLDRVDAVGFGLAHHNPNNALHLTLDEACSLSALLYRVTVQGKVP